MRCGVACRRKTTPSTTRSAGRHHCPPPTARTLGHALGRARTDCRRSRALPVRRATPMRRFGRRRCADSGTARARAALGRVAQAALVAREAVVVGYSGRRKRGRAKRERAKRERAKRERAKRERAAKRAGLHCRGAIGRPGRMDARSSRVAQQCCTQRQSAASSSAHVSRNATCHIRRATCNASSARAGAWAARDGRAFAGLAFSHCRTFGGPTLRPTRRRWTRCTRAWPSSSASALHAPAKTRAVTWHATGGTPGMRQAAHLACDRRHTWRTTRSFALSDCAHRPRHALCDRDGAA